MTASILDQWLCWFQSSPARGGGCNEVEAVVVADAREVSILTRPWGRVQRRGRVSRLGAIPRFNPHPPVGAGATAPKPPEANIIYVVSILTRPWGQVQPRAAERPRHDVVVSILTRPWGRVQPQRPEDGGAGFRVSILTRPWGRVQLITVGQHAYINVSILTRPWGRVQRSFPSLLYTLARFQSSPARGGGCNAHPLAHARRIPQVSILTRPWGRVQPRLYPNGCATDSRFQSSPARGGGCNQLVYLDPDGYWAFQSSPARGGGCNEHHATGTAPVHMVSILTRPWGRVQRGLENARERFPKRKCSSCQGVPCRALGG